MIAIPQNPQRSSNQTEGMSSLLLGKDCAQG
jgi:hypothetical protein